MGDNPDEQNGPKILFSRIFPNPMEKSNCYLYREPLRCKFSVTWSLRHLKPSMAIFFSLSYSKNLIWYISLLHHFLSDPTGSRPTREKERVRKNERRWGRAKSPPASADTRWAPTWLPPQGVAKQYTTADSALFITYRLFPSNSNYHWQAGTYCKAWVCLCRGNHTSKQDVQSILEDGNCQS